jgi:hypothetical protein
MSLLTLFQLDLEITTKAGAQVQTGVSGTVGTTYFSTRQLIDHAFRRCKKTPQEVSSEYLETALELLWLNLQTLNQRGIMMHVVENQLLGLQDSVAALPANTGTLNIYSANLRTIARLTGSASSSDGSAASAFDGDLSTAWAPTTTNATLTLALDSPSSVTSAGLLPRTSGTWSFLLQVSPDNASWTTAVEADSVNVEAGRWLWYDVPGVSSAGYVRVVETGLTTMSVAEVVWGNNQSDIPMSPLDRDTYDALPNKALTGRPVQYWFNRQRTQTYLTLYPAPSSAFVLTSLVVARVQRQLMDVGTLHQTLELPNRWYLPIVADLARHIAAELRDIDMSLLPILEAKANELLAAAWDGETDGAPIRLLPNLRVYRA